MLLIFLFPATKLCNNVEYHNMESFYYGNNTDVYPCLFHCLIPYGPAT